MQESINLLDAGLDANITKICSAATSVIRCIGFGIT